MITNNKKEHQELLVKNKSNEEVLKKTNKLSLIAIETLFQLVMKMPKYFS